MGHTECARECWLNGSKTKAVRIRNLFFSLFFYEKKENHVCSEPEGEGGKCKVIL